MLKFEPLPNKYSRWYFSITKYRKNNIPCGYSENHHIHPECLGGTRAKDNMVRLTAREHYICHLLLTKMLSGEPKKRMAYAFRCMHRMKKGMVRYLPGSYIYQITRAAINFSPSSETRAKMSASGRKRPPITDDTRQKIARAVMASYTTELRALRSKNFSERVVTPLQRKKQSKQRKQWAHIKDETLREKTRKNLSERMSSMVGDKNPRSKTWMLQSPSGQIFTTKDMTSFCSEYNLNYSSLRNRAREKSHIPLMKGLSKGWIVISCV